MGARCRTIRSSGGAAIGGEAGENIQRVFAYGIRNSFGMASDPQSGKLWAEDNGDDSYDEINLIEPGMNAGWIQTMGPIYRVADYKTIALAPGSNLQQQRWPPRNVADTPAEAAQRMFLLPGAQYRDPQFSWRYAVAPAGLGFAGSGLGEGYEGDLIVGASNTALEGGYLFRFRLTEDRAKLVLDGAIADTVAYNARKYDIGESEGLLLGRDFGVGTDIQTGPNGNLYVVSPTKGAVYEIRGRAPRRQRR